MLYYYFCFNISSIINISYFKIINKTKITTKLNWFLRQNKNVKNSNNKFLKKIELKIQNKIVNIYIYIYIVIFI